MESSVFLSFRFFSRKTSSPSSVYFVSNCGFPNESQGPASFIGSIKSQRADPSGWRARRRKSRTRDRTVTVVTLRMQAMS